MQEKPLIRIAVICGPTGTGKTNVAIEIACRLGGSQIISADSMQVYRYMDIGTAKPSPLELNLVRHHLINVVDPDEHYDAQHFSLMGQKIITDLAEQNIFALIVGGTGFYIRALVHGLFESMSVNPELRTALKQEAISEGTYALYRRLCECDPEAAARINKNDSFRITRALEVFETTGQTLSSFHRNHNFKKSFFDVLKIGLSRDRDVLYERINTRVDKMIEEGLLKEVEGLMNRGYSPSLKPMQSIGYRHVASFLEGQLNWDETIDEMKKDTRRYAKRQLTWFNSDPGIEWFDADSTEEIYRKIKGFL